MPGNFRLAIDYGDDGYAQRVMRALDRKRLAAVALTTVLLSLGALGSPALLDFFSPTEIAFAWLEHLLELSVIAALLMVAYTLLDEALPRRRPGRLAAICVLLFVFAGVLTLLLYGYYARGFEHLPPALRLLADSLRWGLPAVFLALIADVHSRALQADSAAHAAELSRAQLEHGEAEQRLALLQAQIEPHFLFNVLGAVRRLYRTQPQAGADAIAGLMRYLRTALHQARNQQGSLSDEIESARAYLELFQVRMGARLTFSIAADPALLAAEFPPMLLVTLLENAIRHGLEPVGGGHIVVEAQRLRNMLEVSVSDDGAGFGAAASSGTGVGLVNVRRQLAARYGNQASFTLRGRQPRGASASISIPLRASPASGSALRVAAV